MARDFDDLLEAVGSFGLYQKRRISLILFPVSFFVAFMVHSLIFQTVVPDYWCDVPGRQNTTLSLEEWKALTLPRSKDSNKYESCLMYKIEQSEVDGANFSVSNETQECNSGWDYDKSQFSATIATSYDWLCDRAEYSQHVLSVNMAGNAVGTIVFSILSDKYLGRRLGFYASLTIHIVGTLLYIWVQNIGLHLVFRFVQGLSFESNYLLSFTIVLEMIPPEQRALTTMITFVAWTVGMCFTALVAWLVPHWQHLALLSVLPSLCGYVYWRFMPESPRWLLAKGRVQECADILQQVARENGTSSLSMEEIKTELQRLSQTQPKDLPLTHALAYPRIRFRAAILLLMSYCAYTVYGVLMFGINVMPSNYFLSHFILSAIELPSNILGWIMTDYLGRRVMCWATFILTAIFCAAAPFCTHNEWLLMSMVATAKLFSTQGLYIVNIMTIEIFPTPIRSSGMGIRVLCGMLAMAIVPYILHSGVSPTFHYWLMVALTVVGLVASLALPETLGLHLPQTFQEAEDLGTDRPLKTWIHHWNKHKYPPPPAKLPPQDMAGANGGARGAMAPPENH